MSNSSTERITVDLRKWVDAAHPGEQLPTTRSLVQRYGASPVTIQKVLRELATRGLIETRVGVGAFVRVPATSRTVDYSWQTAALGSSRAVRKPLSAALRVVAQDAVALHSGYPARELLPERLVADAIKRAARGDSMVSRAPAAGMPELQSWFATELSGSASAGMAAPVPSDVLVLPGSQSGLSTAFRALAGAGQPLLVESPTYWGAILAAEQAGVRMVPIPCGEHGPDPEDVDRALAQSGARVFYAQPNFANPTGAQWPRDRADRILEIVRAHGAFLIEDDWAHDFAISGDAVPLAGRDDSGHVVYLRSLTKSVSPAVRIAGIIARGPAHDRLLSDAQAQSMYVSSVLQQVALDVVTQAAWQKHLRQLRHQLTTRRDLMIRAISQYLPSGRVEVIPKGGLNLWVRLPERTDLPRLVRDCEHLGVIVAAGGEWFPTEPTGLFLRLNFAGSDPGRFAEGADLVEQALGMQLRQ